MSIWFILDNSILSELSKQPRNQNVVEFIETADNLLIPIPTLMEIQFGIALQMQTNPKKAAQLSEWYECLLSSGIPILSQTAADAVVWGELAAIPALKNLRTLQKGGRKNKAHLDLHIAAAAVVHNAAIATADLDFVLIHQWYPLPGVYNPMTDTWLAGEPRGLDAERRISEATSKKVSVSSFVRSEDRVA